MLNDIFQWLKNLNWVDIELWLDGLSNGETALYLALLPAFIIWLLRQLYKIILRPPVAGVQLAEHGEQTTKPNPPTSSENNLHFASSIQATKPLPHTSNTKLFGRKKELSMLTRAWHNDKQNIVVLKAMGGTGKTALLKKWVDGFNDASKRTPYDKIFQWSFYSQGSAEDKQASAEEFIDKALRFFGYQGNPIPSAHDKGIMLAELINQQRTLLVLDGLEPLQYPVGTMHGDLKDKGLLALLQQLAAYNQGLCLISSRQYVVELADKPLVLSHDLGQLQTPDGIALLKSYGVHGSQTELEAAVKEVAGHALALNLLGNYLKTVLQGDIRQRDTIPALSQEREEGKHAETVMAAYESHLKGTTALSILYMMGLFDRPVSIAAIQHLRKAKIPQLTDQLGDETDWQYALQDLRQQQLLNQSTGSDALASQGDTLDTHPLIREYFAKQLKSKAPNAWQQAHQQLYDYYKALPKKQQPDTLEEMQPLFAAIAHGCAAGIHQQALDDVYWPRIRREADMYITNKLGAFGSELSVISHFFSQHWHTPAAELTDEAKAVMFNFAALPLRALGRLQEAVEPMRAGLEMWIKQENWIEAARDASNLSELQLTRGAVADAITTAQDSVELADKSGDWSHRMSKRTTLADAQHQAGQWTKAESLFKQAETLQKEMQPAYPQLYSLQGYRYCDLLLTAGQWREVQQRAEQSLEWAKQHLGLLANALDQLSLGRASLQQAIESVGSVECNETDHEGGMVMVGSAKLHRPYEGNDYFFCVFLPFADKDQNTAQLKLWLQTSQNWLNQAVAGLREAGQEDDLPRGLLARACFYRFCLAVGSVECNGTDHESGTAMVGSAELHRPYDTLKLALQDLQETHDIAQRGGMRLFLCDYHLEAARLCVDTTQETLFDLTAKQHSEKARQLIKKTGYKRRLPELEYLEAML